MLKYPNSATSELSITQSDVTRFKCFCELHQSVKGLILLLILLDILSGKLVNQKDTIPSLGPIVSFRWNVDQIEDHFIRVLELEFQHHKAVFLGTSKKFCSHRSQG